jgi:4-carboxymuconolactone decarboxylase
MPRIPPLPDENWDEELEAILGRRSPGLAGRLGDNNIFPSLARHKDLFRAWLPFGTHLLYRGTLPSRERELLILRTALNCGSAFEWGQHVRIAESIGVSNAEIRRRAAGPDAAGWSVADAALLRAADELHHNAKISDRTWAELAGTYDERGLIEITMLVGHYHVVAFALNCLEVELDDGLESLPDQA